jgi:hypothetical protein
MELGQQTNSSGYSMVAAVETQNLSLNLLANPIYEEPYAGNPLVRVCGGAGR